jgi:hypothetical protein
VRIGDDAIGVADILSIRVVAVPPSLAAVSELARVLVNAALSDVSEPGLVFSLITMLGRLKQNQLIYQLSNEVLQIVVEYLTLTCMVSTDGRPAYLLSHGSPKPVEARLLPRIVALQQYSIPSKVCLFTAIVKPRGGNFLSYAVEKVDVMYRG